MSIKQELSAHLTQWQQRVEAEDTDFWFNTQEFLTEVTALNTELESCTQTLIDTVKGGEERAALITNLNFLRNLLISWKEGLHRNVLGAKHLADFKTRWVDRIGQTLDLLGQIIEEEPEHFDEVESVVPAGQKTLFTTASKQRRKEVNETGDFDGAVFLSDAEETLASLADARRRLPNANAKSALNVVTTRVPIIPKFEPYVSAEQLNNLGFRAQQLGSYTIMHDQILLGLNTKWCREKNLNMQERQLLINQAVLELGNKYGTPMMVALDKSVATPHHGYTFYWIMSEGHLNTIRHELEAAPIDWGLV